MGEKKRKDLPTSSDGPKKSKKAKVVAEAGPAAGPAAPAAAAVKKSQRGRAADYMSGDEEEADGTAAAPSAAAAKTGKKETGKKEKGKGKKAAAQTLTADGTNGVVEHAESEQVEPLPGSLQAEAQDTVEAELRDEYGTDGGQDDAAESGDLGAALLAGFDSDTSDHAEDTGLDVGHLGGIPHYKKTKKKLSKIVKSGKDKPGTVYVGRIPHGFYERQMREYFGQFGEVTRLRLSRNRRTGASKHFAFVEFASEEVAKIVAETMDNYLMFGHILKCKFAPAENLHPDVWKGADKKFRRIPHQKLERQRLEAPKTADHWAKANVKEARRRSARAKALKEKLGYDAPVVELAEPASALAANEQEAQQTKAIEAAAPAPEETATAEPAEPVEAKKAAAKQKATRRAKKAKA